MKFVIEPDVRGDEEVKEEREDEAVKLSRWVSLCNTVRC